MKRSIAVARAGRPEARQLAVVGVRAVEEAALLRQQPAGPLAGGVPTVPADRPRPDAALDRRHRQLDLPPLLFLGHLKVLAPAVAVAARLVPQLPQRR